MQASLYSLIASFSLLYTRPSSPQARQTWYLQGFIENHWFYLEANWGRQLTSNRAPSAAGTPLEPIKKRSKIKDVFTCLLEPIFDGFGNQMGAKIDPKCCQNGFRNGIGENFRVQPCFFHWLLMMFTPRRSEKPSNSIVNVKVFWNIAFFVK